MLDLTARFSFVPDWIRIYAFHQLVEQWTCDGLPADPDFAIAHIRSIRHPSQLYPRDRWLTYPDVRVLPEMYRLVCRLRDEGFDTIKIENAAAREWIQEADMLRKGEAFSSWNLRWLDAIANLTATPEEIQDEDRSVVKLYEGLSAWTQEQDTETLARAYRISQDPRFAEIIAVHARVMSPRLVQQLLSEPRALAGLACREDITQPQALLVGAAACRYIGEPRQVAALDWRLGGKPAEALASVFSRLARDGTPGAEAASEQLVAAVEDAFGRCDVSGLASTARAVALRNLQMALVAIPEGIRGEVAERHLSVEGLFGAPELARRIAEPGSLSPDIVRVVARDTNWPDMVDLLDARGALDDEILRALVDPEHPAVVDRLIESQPALAKRVREFLVERIPEITSAWAASATAERLDEWLRGELPALSPVVFARLLARSQDGDMYLRKTLPRFRFEVEHARVLVSARPTAGRLTDWFFYVYPQFALDPCVRGYIEMDEGLKSLMEHALDPREIADRIKHLLVTADASDAERVVDLLEGLPATILIHVGWFDAEDALLLIDPERRGRVEEMIRAKLADRRPDWWPDSITLTPASEERKE